MDHEFVGPGHYCGRCGFSFDLHDPDLDEGERPDWGERRAPDPEPLSDLIARLQAHFRPQDVDRKPLVEVFSGEGEVDITQANLWRLPLRQAPAPDLPLFPELGPEFWRLPPPVFPVARPALSTVFPNLDLSKETEMPESKPKRKPTKVVGDTIGVTLVLAAAGVVLLGLAWVAVQIVRAF